VKQSSNYLTPGGLIYTNKHNEMPMYTSVVEQCVFELWPIWGKKRGACGCQSRWSHSVETATMTFSICWVDIIEGMHAHAIGSSVNDSWRSISPYLIQDATLQTKESVESSCTLCCPSIKSSLLNYFWMINIRKDGKIEAC